MSDAIWSPCIQVCFVDPGKQMCVGCFRTLEELGRWTQMTQAERLALKPTFEARRTAYEAERAKR